MPRLIILALAPGGWLTERIAAVGRARLQQLSRHVDPDDRSIFYGWGFGLFARWDRAAIYLVPPSSGRSCCCGRSRGSTASATARSNGLWRSLARLKLQPMRKPLPARQRRKPRSGRNPGWPTLRPKPPAAGAGSSGLVARSNKSTVRLEQAAQLDDLGNELVGEAAGFDADARGALDQLGDLGERLGAELAGLALDVCAGRTSAAVFSLVHRLFDLRDRLGAVLAEIARECG